MHSECDQEIFFSLRLFFKGIDGKCDDDDVEGSWRVADTYLEGELFPVFL